jgi:tRNA(Ile)-lysidine synthase
LLGLPADSSLLVACSGGADSGAALLLLRQARPQAKLYACYVDHALRPASDIKRDIRAVESHARAAGAKVIIEQPASAGRLGKGRPKTSLEARARELRYAALLRAARTVGARFVITGHQRDDLVESSLLALARGSGIDGVAAMRPRRRLGNGVGLARPLLWATKAQLEMLLREEGLEHSYDVTNTDLRLRRNLVRGLLHELEMEAPGSSGAIARSAALLREDQSLLEALTAQAWRSCQVIEDAGSLSAAKLRLLPLALLRRVVRYAVRDRSGSARDFHFSHCDAVARALLERRGGTFHAGAVRVVLSAGRLYVEGTTGAKASGLHERQHQRSHERSTEVLVPKKSGSSRTPWGTVLLKRGSALEGAIALDAAQFLPGTRLFVRAPRAGDKVVPAGRHRPVSLARFLAKAGVVQPQRSSVPLLCKGDSIVAVLGIRAAEPYAARAGREVLSVAWTSDNEK